MWGRNHHLKMKKEKAYGIAWEKYSNMLLLYAKGSGMKGWHEYNGETWLKICLFLICTSPYSEERKYWPIIFVWVLSILFLLRGVLVLVKLNGLLLCDIFIFGCFGILEGIWPRITNLKPNFLSGFRDSFLIHLLGREIHTNEVV